MGEDLDRERKIFIATTSSGIEIPSIIKEFDIEQYKKDISTLTPQLSIDELEFRIKQAFNMDFGYFLKTLTKKRTKKILMSRGYSRNEANALLEDIEHRTMSHLDKFFPKNN